MVDLVRVGLRQKLDDKDRLIQTLQKENAKLLSFVSAFKIATESHLSDEVIVSNIELLYKNFYFTLKELEGGE